MLPPTYMLRPPRFAQRLSVCRGSDHASMWGSPSGGGCASLGGNSLGSVPTTLARSSGVIPSHSSCDGARGSSGSNVQRLLGCEGGCMDEQLSASSVTAPGLPDAAPVRRGMGAEGGATACAGGIGAIGSRGWRADWLAAGTSGQRRVRGGQRPAMARTYGWTAVRAGFPARTPTERLGLGGRASVGSWLLPRNAP
jgi:hypothetical protein